MFIIKNVNAVDGRVVDIEVPLQINEELDASGLTAIPAVIDPHVHFRTPGLEHKEDWVHASRAAIKGGCTTVFDMPNVLPPTITKDLLAEKKSRIEQQLSESGIPLRYDLYIGADKSHFDQIPLVKNHVVGIKVFMGCSTGDLVIDDDESLEKIFSIAANNDMLVAVHAEDEEMLVENQKQFMDADDYSCHSKIRSVAIAVRAVEKAISLTRKYGTRLYILHVSSNEEIALIRKAKQEGLPVFAETTPHHFYLNTSAYEKLKGRACVNPSLREANQHDAIVAAIKEGVIDTIGSDHAPHTQDEKDQPYGQCPSGMPGIEFLLPILLDSYHKGELTLDEIVGLTSRNAKKIFRLPDTEDWVLCDLERRETVTRTESKCGWSPYMGLTFTGWPVYTIMRGALYSATEPQGLAV